MADPDEGKGVPIIWEVPGDLPTHYATHLVVQHTDEDFTITFFDLRPPLLMGPPEAQKQLEAMQIVRPKALARIVVSPARMRQFIQVMQDNLKTFEEKLAEAPARGAKP